MLYCAVHLPEENFPVASPRERAEPCEGEAYVEQGQGVDEEEEEEKQEEEEMEGVEGESKRGKQEQRGERQPAASTDDAASVPDRSIYPWSSAPPAAAAVGAVGAEATGEEDGRTEDDPLLAISSTSIEGVPSKAEALALPDGEYLSGCRVMLVGFGAEALLPLTLLIRKGCGVR